jgi:hypothetical protein
MKYAIVIRKTGGLTIVEMNDHEHADEYGTPLEDDMFGGKTYNEREKARAALLMWLKKFSQIKWISVGTPYMEDV